MLGLPMAPTAASMLGAPATANARQVPWTFAPLSGERDSRAKRATGFEVASGMPSRMDSAPPVVMPYSNLHGSLVWYPAPVPMRDPNEAIWPRGVVEPSTPIATSFVRTTSRVLRHPVRPAQVDVQADEPVFRQGTGGVAGLGSHRAGAGTGGAPIPAAALSLAMGGMNMALPSATNSEDGEGNAVEISCRTDLAYDVARFSWKLADFMLLRQMAQSRSISPEGDVVSSPVYLDSTNSQWWLRLYPWEHREEHAGNVSLFLHTDRAMKDPVCFSFVFSIMDEAGQRVRSKSAGVRFYRFDKSTGIRNYGFYDFVLGEGTELRDVLLSERGTLWVSCQLHIFVEPATEVTRIATKTILNQVSVDEEEEEESDILSYVLDDCSIVDCSKQLTVA